MSCRGWKGHDWGKWEVIEKGQVENSKTGGRTGNYLVQQRICKECSKVELNTQTVHI